MENEERIIETAEGCSVPMIMLDEGTGVLTRGSTMSSIEEYLLGEGMSGTHALVMLDVDNFKTINDTLGHICGDTAIYNIAQIVLSQFRKDDIIGRVGGDEFFVFVKNADAAAIKNKVSELLTMLQIVITNGDNHIVTSVSAGIAMYYGDSPNPKTLKNLYSEADVALYKAKDAGKNTCAFAEGQDAPATSKGASSTDAAVLDLRSMLNQISFGIVIFHGNSCAPEDIKPIFCNDGYLRMSGFTAESFKEQLQNRNDYCIHPDDIKAVKKQFAKALFTREPFKYTFRVVSQMGGYKWISASANIRYLDDDAFEVYMVFTDADKEMREHMIEMQRYNNYLELARQTTDDTMLTARMNITENHCSVFYRNEDMKNDVSLEQSMDEFIDEACRYIPDEGIQKAFRDNFSRWALASNYDNGKFHSSMQIPIRLDNKRIVWCRHMADVTKNPATGDLECVMRLIDSDIKIRFNDHFERMLHADYEVVADINAETGIVTIISETQPCAELKVAGKMTYYMDERRARTELLIDGEFVEECLKATDLDTVKKKLEEMDIYTCTFPANSIRLGKEGTYQWRFGYVGSDKTDILFSRREMIGFLDSRHRELSEPGRKDTEKLLFGDAANEVRTRRRNILIADDVDMNREMLRIIFENDFDIIEAADGEKAIEIIDKNYDTLALILLDFQMPKKTGLDVLLHIKLRNLNEKIPVIMVTGSSSNDMNLRSLEYGIAEIINKPFDSKIVRRRALNLIELYAHKEDVELQMERWKEEAIQLHIRNEKNSEMLINTLSSVVEFRSLESGLHIKRVRKLTEILLKIWTTMFPEDYFDDETINQISRASTLHDIGKVAIPDNILLKPGRLTPEEFDIMKKHTVFGCEMLENFKEEDSTFFRYCYDICRHHHERSDGRGYPDGLKGNDIPIWAQIVSIVDVFDALISPRVYKPAYTPEKAVDMIRGGECGTFTEKLLACFEMAKDSIIAESLAMNASEKEGKTEQ